MVDRPSFISYSSFQKAQLGKVVEEAAAAAAAPIVHAQSTVHLTDLEDVQFQRSMSLPRGFGGQRQQPSVHHVPVVPPPRSDSMHALRTIMMRRHKVKVISKCSDMLSFFEPCPDSIVSLSLLVVHVSFPFFLSYFLLLLSRLSFWFLLPYVRSVSDMITAVWKSRRKLR